MDLLGALARHAMGDRGGVGPVEEYGPGAREGQPASAGRPARGDASGAAAIPAAPAPAPASSDTDPDAPVRSLMTAAGLGNAPDEAALPAPALAVPLVGPAPPSTPSLTPTGPATPDPSTGDPPSFQRSHPERPLPPSQPSPTAPLQAPPVSPTARAPAPAADAQPVVRAEAIASFFDRSMPIEASTLRPAIVRRAERTGPAPPKADPSAPPPAVRVHTGQIPAPGRPSKPRPRNGRALPLVGLAQYVARRQGR
jgi:hypothetical protein